MRKLSVDKNDAGQRFDKFLAKYMNTAPKSFFYKMLRKKNIVLNGKKAEGSEKVSEGDIVTLFLSDETIDDFRTEKEVLIVNWNFKVLYEDSHILLVDKPVGVLSQRSEKTDISLNEMIKSYLISTNQMTVRDMERFTPAVCNRLDRNTSGIVTAGKSLLGLQELTRLFRTRVIEKYYYSIVIGQMTVKKQINAYIVKDDEKNIVKIVEKTETDDIGISKIEAVYEPIGVYGNYTFLQIKLITGKTHQIRAHLAHMGHPVLGDYKYGNRNVNQIYKKKYGIDYQLLHAGKLIFPIMTGELSGVSLKCIEAELPEDFKKVLTDIISNGENSYASV